MQMIKLTTPCRLLPPACHGCMKMMMTPARGAHCPLLLKSSKQVNSLSPYCKTPEHELLLLGGMLGTSALGLGGYPAAKMQPQASC